VPIPEQLELTRLVGFLLQYSESALSGDASAIETVLRHELTALVSQLASERAGIGRALAWLFDALLPEYQKMARAAAEIYGQ